MEVLKVREGRRHLLGPPRHPPRVLHAVELLLAVRVEPPRVTAAEPRGRAALLAGRGLVELGVTQLGGYIDEEF